MLKIKQLISRLEKIEAKHGNIVVMFTDPNNDDGPYTVSSATSQVAEEDEFPDSFNMPAGFKYVLLRN